MLIHFPRVTDSRTQNLVFRRPCSFLWFSIVSYNNYGGDSKLCFLQILIFLVRRPVAISVATDGDSTGGARESDHLFGCAKLMWFFFIFFLSHFFGYAFFIFFLIFKIIVCVYSILFIFVFGIIVRCGFR